MRVVERRLLSWALVGCLCLGAGTDWLAARIAARLRQLGGEP